MQGEGALRPGRQAGSEQADIRCLCPGRAPLPSDGVGAYWSSSTHQGRAADLRAGGRSRLQANAEVVSG